MPDGVGGLEGIEELVEDVLFGLLAGHNVWMFLSVVPGTDVVNVKNATLIQIDNCESFLGKGNSTGVHGSHDLAKELVIDDLTVVIGVESIKDCFELQAVAGDTVALESLGKLGIVESTRVIVVHDLETLSKVEDSTGTSGLDDLAHALNQLIISGEGLILVAILLGLASSTLTLHGNSLLCREISSLAATCSRHERVDLIALLRRTGTDVRYVVSQELVLGLSVEDLVVLVLPLFTRVLATDAWVLSSELVGTDGDKVHVPDTDEEVLELEVLFKSLIHKLMVFSEFRSGDGFVSTKLVVSIVEGGEHLKEAKASLLSRFGSSDDIRVSGWVEVVLHFFELERAVTVCIKLVESFGDEALAEGIQLTTEGSQKFVKADLAITTPVENAEKTLSIAGTHAWDAVVVENGLELREGELT